MSSMDQSDEYTGILLMDFLSAILKLNLNQNQTLKASMTTPAGTNPPGANMNVYIIHHVT